MQYRTFGRLDWQVSALGFGAMRLPVLDGDPGKIDEAEAARMLYYAIDHGVNYVDTAYPYHQGTSETFLGKVLQGRYRQQVRLATKLPSWLVESSDDFDRYLDEQLERLQTDHIDFYLLHALNENNWAKLRDLNVLRWAEGAMADGRIRHLGFSFHDKYPVFKEIVDAYDGWTFCQIQYNYMDETYQAGTRGVALRRRQGIGRGGDGAHPGRSAGQERSPARAGAVGRRALAAHAGRVGLAMGVEPPGSLGGAQRHEHDGAGKAKRRQRRPVGPRHADGGRAGPDRPRAR